MFFRKLHNVFPIVFKYAFAVRGEPVVLLGILINTTDFLTKGRHRVAADQGPLLRRLERGGRGRLLAAGCERGENTEEEKGVPGHSWFICQIVLFPMVDFRVAEVTLF